MSKIFSKRILLALAIILIFFIGCNQENEHLNLKVLIVNDSRFPNITREDYNNIFLNLPKIAKRLFNLNIKKIQVIEEINISEFLERYKEKPKEKINLFDNPEKIYREQLTSVWEEEKESIIKFLGLEEENPKVIMDYIFKVYAKNLKIIKSATYNKTPIIHQDSLENSYSFFEEALRKTSEYEIILINTLIMDDSTNKDFPPAIHTLIRGGVTVGAALKSLATYKGTIIFSIFPFVADIEPFNANKNAPMDHRNKIIAYYLIHEIGHLFMYYPDNYENLKCVMCPARGFDFLKWYLQVKDGYCEKPNKRIIKYIREYYHKTK